MIFFNDYNLMVLLSLTKKKAKSISVDNEIDLALTKTYVILVFNSKLLGYLVRFYLLSFLA